MDNEHKYAVAEHCLPEKPKAVVLLLGWWGAKMQHLSKYASLYHERDCVTVQARVSPYAVLVFDKKSMETFAKQTVEHVANVLRMYPDRTDLPVYIHAFSNGGAYVVERIETMIREAQSETDREKNGTKKANASEANTILFDQHLRGQIFDSAPAYPDTKAAIRATREANPKNPLVVGLTIAFFRIMQVYTSVCSALGVLREYQPFFAWNNLMTSQCCKKQAFIYSSLDHITDMTHLENFIEARRQQPGSQILVEKFDDSLHVLHYRKHPETYEKVIDRVLSDSW